MKKVMLALGATAVAFSMSACQHAKPGAVETNATVQQDVAQAQQIVQGCISKGNVLTHDGRQAILNCIAPKGHEVQFQSCAQGKLATDGVLSKSQRTKFYQDLAVCVETNR